MVNHDNVKDQLVSFVLGELSEPQRDEVRAHVAQCDQCRAELGRLERLLQSAAQRKGLSADESLYRSAQESLFAAADRDKDKIIALPERRRAFEWRSIMASSITKIGVAAVVAVAVGYLSISTLQRSQNNGAGFGLLAKACAAEESLFTGTDIIHIQNEIIVQGGAGIGMGFVWLPMCSMKPDGTLRMNQLKFNAAPESYVVTDHSWYDPATGRFSRILKTGESVVFANSYDGQFVYDANMAPGGAVQVSRQPIAAAFKPPQSPAEYLGLAAGLTTSLSQDDSMVQSVQESTLADGEPVHVFTVGIPDPDGNLPGYWLFKVRDKDSTIAEKEFVLQGRSQLLIRRVLTEPAQSPGVAWNLAELEGTAAQASQQVSFTPDMVVQGVSVQHMVDRATFETYVFSVKPAWTGEVEIIDCIDPATPGGRMFIFAARAADGRHLVLVQSPTYNMALAGSAKRGTLVYTSPNGFRVWGGGPEKWYSKILLDSARFSIKDPPSEDRIGYILESPAGTFPALAVNGPLSDEELHKLVDSLTPAKDYLHSRDGNPQEKQ
jgi:hypothetical protein